MTPPDDELPELMPTGFVPPPYPYDRLSSLAAIAEALPGGMVDLSIGTPCDPPGPAVVAALSSSNSERGYPPSIGTPELRAAVQRWLRRRFAVEVPASQIAACVGTKELVGTLPQFLRLRSPERDTVLYPEVSYPTYAMGAILAGCRAVPVPTDADFRLRLDAIEPDDAARALVLWVNSPGNPTGAVDDLGAAATWGRQRGVPVFSDECYCEFTWDGPPRTILEHGLDGVVAVHSLSKRSNLAGLRVGFYAGDAGAGGLPPGGAQARRPPRARAGASGRSGGARRRRPRERPARPLPRAVGSHGSRALPVERHRSRSPCWRLLPLVRCR